jgi:hypothetical protein
VLEAPHRQEARQSKAKVRKTWGNGRANVARPTYRGDAAFLSISVRACSWDEAKQTDLNRREIYNLERMEETQETTSSTQVPTPGSTPDT